MKVQTKKYELDFSMTETCSSDLKVLFATDYLATEKEENNIHMHSFWELVFVQHGEILVHLDNRILCVGRNEILLIPPMTYHFVDAEHGVGKFCIHFAFEKGKSQDHIKLFDEIFAGFPAKEIFQVPDPCVGSLLMKIFENQKNDRVGKDARLQGSIMELIFHLYDRLKTEQLPGFDFEEWQMGYWKHRYALESLLCRYYAVDISQEELCGMIGISTPSLTRVFASVYGESFGDMKLELKIRNAKRLIEETNLSIGEIGKRIGYTSARGFLIAFRRSENCTPSEYRRSIQKNQF